MVKSPLPSHEGPCVICALGPSFSANYLDLLPDYKVPRIGLNDATRLTYCRYTLLIDNVKETRSPVNRWDDLQRIGSEVLYTVEQDELVFKNPGMRVEHIVIDVIQPNNIEDLLSRGILPVSITSVLPAMGLALLMGFQTIGIIGFDLYGDVFSNPGVKHNHSSSELKIKQLNALCTAYQQYAAKHDAIFYNLSLDSKITTLPKISIPDYNKLAL